MKIEQSKIDHIKKLFSDIGELLTAEQAREVLMQSADLVFIKENAVGVVGDKIVKGVLEYELSEMRLAALCRLLRDKRIPPTDYTKVPVNQLGLRDAVSAVLKKNKLHTVGDLKTKTVRELRKIEGLNANAVNQIVEALETLGVNLGY